MARQLGFAGAPGRWHIVSVCLGGLIATLAVLPACAADLRADLSYYDGPDADPDKHRLDLYLPDQAHAAPVLVWIHGGAWAVGQRTDDASFARRLADQGIAVACISYRLSPGTWIDPSLTDGVTHPAHAIDCARAVAFIAKHAAELGIDAERIFMGGYSCGAHLSALLATDPTYLEDQGLEASSLRAAIPVAGAYDMQAYYASHLEGNGAELANAHVLGVFGSQEALLGASPSTHVGKASTPMLVISETDTYEYTRLFEERVTAVGRSDVAFRHVRTLNHSGLSSALNNRDASPTRQAIVDYIQSLLGDQAN